MSILFSDLLFTFNVVEVVLYMLTCITRLLIHSPPPPSTPAPPISRVTVRHHMIAVRALVLQLNDAHVNRSEDELKNSIKVHKSRLDGFSAIV